MENKYSIGCDIGGTFTDFVLLDLKTNERYIKKHLTTYPDPSEGVIEGIEELFKDHPSFLKETHSFLHGTTLIINAIIERKGAKVGLITTEGFRDLTEIWREIRYDKHDIHAKFPAPLVPRYLRREVSERIYADGRVLKELDLEETKRIIKELEGEQVESIAVSLMHSYKNPIHENAIKKIILDDFPHLSYSISSEILPEIREFERTITTIANAYVKQLVERYVDAILSDLERLGFEKKMYLMLSSGGLTPAETAKEFPVRLIESGPVSGLIAANYCVNLAGNKADNIISFDMGGTTAKSAIITKGKISMTREYEVAREARFKKGSGIPLKISAVDMIEIGAGGGSIGMVNKYGLLQVGPESAGASPGPACYHRGGVNPTVTDADLVLGYLDPEFFLGGSMKLDLDDAIFAIEEKIGKPLDLTLIEAAWGIHNMVNENMAAALKIFCGEKGEDPSMYSIVAFGGAGPLHSYGLAKKVKSAKIVIPLGAGTFSALGFFIAPITFEVFSTTYGATMQEANFDHIETIYREMEEKAAGYLSGEDRDTLQFSRSADLRYVGQDYEINIPIPSSNFSGLTKEELTELYSKVYRTTYGREYSDLQIEFVEFRVTAKISQPALQLEATSRGSTSESSALKKSRKAYSSVTQDYEDFKVYDRYLISPGMTIKGPAIVEEKESTIVVDLDSFASVDEYENVVINLNTKGDR